MCCEAQLDSLPQKEVSKQLTKQWPEIKQQLDFLGTNLTKWNLVKAIKILSEARKRRFLRRRTPEYGSMNKGFSEAELEKFFSMMDDPKAHLLFSFQAIIGLRIGEAVKVNINLKTRELRIFTEKSGKTDYLLIPVRFFDAVLQVHRLLSGRNRQGKGFPVLFTYPIPQREGDRTQNHDRDGKSAFQQVHQEGKAG